MTVDREAAVATPHRYRCPACGEPLVYNEAFCKNCQEYAPIYNRSGFWLSLWIALGALGISLLLSLL